MSQTGFIYAIQAEHVHLIKLGYSADPAARLADLKTGSAVTLTILAVWRGTVADEQELHREMITHHSHGEWFRPAPAVVGRLLQRNEASPAYLAELNGQRRAPVKNNGNGAPKPKQLRTPGKLACPSGYDLRFRKNGSVSIYQCLGNGHRPKRRPAGTIAAEEAEAISRLSAEEQRERIQAKAAEAVL